MFTKLKSSKSRRFLKGGEGQGGEEGGLPTLSLHSVIRDSLTYDNQFSEKVCLYFYAFDISFVSIFFSCLFLILIYLLLHCSFNS